MSSQEEPEQTICFQTEVLEPAKATFRILGAEFSDDLSAEIKSLLISLVRVKATLTGGVLYIDLSKTSAKDRPSSAVLAGARIEVAAVSEQEGRPISVKVIY